MCISEGILCHLCVDACAREHTALMSDCWVSSAEIYILGIALILKIATVLAVVVLSASTQGISGTPTSGAPANGPSINRAARVSKSFISPVSSNGSLEERVNEFQKSTAPVSQAKLEALIETAAVEQIKTSSGEVLAADQAFSSNTDQVCVMLRVPFKGKPNLLPESGYSVFLDTSGRVVASGEMVLNQIAEHPGRITMWQDGSKLVDRVVEDPNRPQQVQPGQSQTALSGDKLNSRLATAGIAAWVIKAIGVACGAARAPTVGVGCVVCAIAASGIAGTTIGTCGGQAMTV